VWQRWQGGGLAGSHAAARALNLLLQADPWLCSLESRSGDICASHALLASRIHVSMVSSDIEGCAHSLTVSGDALLHLLSQRTPSLPLAFRLSPHSLVPGAQPMLLARRCPPGVATAARAPAAPRGGGWAGLPARRGQRHRHPPLPCSPRRCCLL